jgi:hypothetical protein
MYNRDKVDNFSQQYAAYVGQLMPCHYDPWDIRSGAVLRAVLPGWEVFHAVLWPVAGVAIGLLVCIVFCRRCHHGTATRLDVTATVPEDKSTESHTGPDDVSSYVVAAKALLQAQKRHRRHHHSIRSLWMVYQNT